MIVSLMGGGGKTTTLFYLAEKYGTAGKSVIMSTSTHMQKNEDFRSCYADSDEKLRDFLQGLDRKKAGIFLLGMDAGNKISSPAEDLFSLMDARADLVLVEADGSKGLPAKFHAEHEPVPVKGSALCIFVFGLDALDEPLCKVCHRHEVAMEYFGWEKDARVDTERAFLLLERMYLRVKERVNAPAVFVLNKADNGERTAQARKLQTKIAEAWGCESFICAHGRRDIDLSSYMEEAEE